MATTLENLSEWIGRRETLIDHVTIPAVHRLAAMLDRDDPMPKNGDPLPLGWHAIFFPRVTRQSQIGPDGHPERGDFLPPVPLPRRMFAGRRVTFHKPLRIGDESRSDSVIAGVTPKQGRSGLMVFVTVKTEICGRDGLAISQEQDIVYRGEPDPNAPPPAPQTAPQDATWSRTIVADQLMLFRFSALTYNGHRIHYDYPYVTGTEGYPDLVVNGGLTTLLLVELARAHASAPLRSMSSRNLRPLFVNRPFRLCGAPSPDGKAVKLWAADDTGALALQAEGALE